MKKLLLKLGGGAIKFTFKLKPHEVGSLMRIVAVQINDNEEVISETDVGYIEGKYADRISFKEMTDWGGKTIENRY